MKVTAALALTLALIWSCSAGSDPAETAPTWASDGGTVGAALTDASGASPPSRASADAAPDAHDAAPPSDPRDAPGVFVGVGNHLRHVRSVDDGVTWIDDATDITTGSTGDEDGIRTVIWGHDAFVAFAAKVFTSPDGKIWTQVPKTNGQWLASMIYAQNQYVSSGGYGWLATTTTDLGNWTQHPPYDGYTVAHHSRGALAFGTFAGADAYVVVDDAGNVFCAPDGKTWRPVTGAPIVPAGNTWGTSFTFGGGTFVGLLPGGLRSMRSTDGGATWTENDPFGSAVASVVYAQGHFTAVGAGHVFTSDDGGAWTDHADATAPAGDLAYGHGTYLALRGGGIFRSTTGFSWSQAFDDGNATDRVASIAFGPH